MDLTTVTKRSKFAQKKQSEHEEDSFHLNGNGYGHMLLQEKQAGTAPA